MSVGRDAMEGQLILRVVSKFLIPVIMLFALYVQFHGEYGPGGGFQAGVIMASALIVHMLVFGLDETQRVAPLPVLRALSAAGVLLYGAVGVVAMLFGGNFLDYGALGPTAPTGQVIGIIVIELGVGITVASTMVLLAYLFATRVRER
jgi:multicomponent Na+:H+ antiporter subunit B